MLKRLFGGLAAFAVLFSLCPAYAVDFGVEADGVGVDLSLIKVEGDVDVVGFADYVAGGLIFANNTLHNKLNQDVCPNAPQLNGGHRFEPVRTMKNGQVGLFYQCTQCGKAYGDMLDEVYDEYVETLPGQTVNSDGSFIWQMTLDAAPDFVRAKSYYELNIYLDGRARASYVGNGWALYGYSIPGKHIFSVAIDGEGTGQLRGVFLLNFAFTPPFDATYELISGGFPNFVSRFAPAKSAYYMGQSETSTELNIAWPTFRVTPLKPPFEFSASQSDNRVGGNVSGSGSTGLYGYVQDGQLYQSTVSNIYNETSNVYQNPVTGDTKNVSSWNYDYSDRSYTLNTEEGDTVTLTYGDEYITISDAGTTYNVYYLMDEPANVREEAVHIHSYSSSVTTEATCTASGVKTYVCSGCNDTYTETIPALGHSYASGVVTVEPTCTETGVKTSTCTVCGDEKTEVVPALGHSYVSTVSIEPTCVNTGVTRYVCSTCGHTYTGSIPATGHIWEIKKTVSNQYDEDTGELTQAGYTLYECATCGEQYRIDSSQGESTLPNASSGGVSSGGSSGSGSGTGSDGNSTNDVGAGFLLRVAGGLTEDLPQVLDMMSQWFTRLPALFDDYSNFLAVSFRWLPADMLLLLHFGFGMVVVIGIIKAIRR